jgi:hypothetical protein
MDGFSEVSAPSITISPSFVTFTPSPSHRQSAPSHQHHHRHRVIIAIISSSSCSYARAPQQGTQQSAAMRCPNGSGGRGPRHFTGPPPQNIDGPAAASARRELATQRPYANPWANAARYYGRACAQGKIVDETRNVVPTAPCPDTVVERARKA